MEIWKSSNDRDPDPPSTSYLSHTEGCPLRSLNSISDPFPAGRRERGSLRERRSGMENGVCQEKPKESYIQDLATTHHAEDRKPRKLHFFSS
jgi:hypothetical protein